MYVLLVERFASSKTSSQRKMEEKASTRGRK